MSDPLGVFQSMKGITAGVGLAWSPAPMLEIQPELLYVQKGVSFGESEGSDTQGNPTGTFETLHVVNAIEVPLLLGWEVPLGSRLHPVLEAGPFVSFEISERTKMTGSENLSVDANLLKNTDYGMVLGAGLELDMGPGRWILHGRFEPGLADLGDFYGSGGVHSGAWVLATGYRY